MAAARFVAPVSSSSASLWAALRRPLAVVAHPDDESFGLGALLDLLVCAGAAPAVLCFTQGEASTVHGVEGDLRQLRAGELRRAAGVLGVESVTLLDEPDGALDRCPAEGLAESVARVVRDHGADGLLVFDVGGVTGHPDHDAATRAALAAAERAGLPVFAWALPAAIADLLNAETGAGFVGRRRDEVDLIVRVDRTVQTAAVREHPSQAVPGSVLWRRLDLLGGVEHLRLLRDAAGAGPIGRQARNNTP